MRDEWRGVKLLDSGTIDHRTGEPRPIDGPTRRYLIKWCEEHCIGEWQHSNASFFFEKDEDAVHFKLRWAE